MSCETRKQKDQRTVAHAMYCTDLQQDLFVLACTHGKKGLMKYRDVNRRAHTILSCSRTQTTPSGVAQTVLNPTNPSIATSYHPINKVWPSFNLTSIYMGRKAYTCRYMILTRGEIRLSLFNHAVEIGPVKYTTGANPERLRSHSSKRLQ